MSYEKLMKRQADLTLARFGFDGTKVEQGSQEWKDMRLGVITASSASNLIATGGMAPFPEDVEIVKTGRQNIVSFHGNEFTGTKAECIKYVRSALPRVPSEARKTYLLELIAEVATGQQSEQGEFKQTQWGHEYENSARQIFAFHVGVPVQPVTFLFGNDALRYGCSPDGIADDFSGIEIKCPWTTKVYLDFLLNGEIKQDYIDQVQFSMFVTGMNYWHFANYDPRMRNKSFESIVVERDEEKMKTFADAVGQMAHDMDVALDRLGMKFGDQWAGYQLKEAA